MAKINLLRKSTSFDKTNQSYRLTLEITSTESIDKNLFIKQRFRNSIKNNFDDVFVAVATPAQVEELDINSPAPNTSFFRASSIDLVSVNAAYLEEVFSSIVRELQKLVEDNESLNLLNTDGIYEITTDDVVINTDMVHTHYRLPLVARPSGDNFIYTEGGVDKQRVANQDTNAPGWLNTTELAGYNFKYNIAKDTALSALWPIPTNKLQYAHLEVDGITWTDVRITADGIYWKDNLKDAAPFPSDYVSPSNVGTPPILVLDFIV